MFQLALVPSLCLPEMVNCRAVPLFKLNVELLLLVMLPSKTILLILVLFKAFWSSVSFATCSVVWETFACTAGVFVVLVVAATWTLEAEVEVTCCELGVAALTGVEGWNFFWLPVKMAASCALLVTSGVEVLLVEGCVAFTSVFFTTWGDVILSAWTDWLPIPKNTNPINTEAAPIVNLRIENLCFCCSSRFNFSFIFFLDNIKTITSIYKRPCYKLISITPLLFH